MRRLLMISTAALLLSTSLPALAQNAPSFGGPPARIANIYDYTYALDAVKIGEPVAIVVLRNNQRLRVNVTPEARK